MEYKFMQLGGNCAYLAFINKDRRLRGPVDNVILSGVNGIKLLIENKFYNGVTTQEFSKKRRPATANIAIQNGDYPYFSIFPNETIWFVHNDPSTDKFKDELRTRCANFNAFLQDVRTDNHSYFIVTINQRMVDLVTHELKGTVLIEILNYLSSIQLLDKTIFVGTHAQSTKYANGDYRLTASALSKLQTTHTFKYIEIDNVCLTDTTDNEKQFIQRITKLLVN